MLSLMRVPGARRVRANHRRRRLPRTLGRRQRSASLQHPRPRQWQHPWLSRCLRMAAAFPVLPPPAAATAAAALAAAVAVDVVVVVAASPAISRRF